MEQTVSVAPEREAQHLPPGFRWRHRLSSIFCDSTHRSTQNVPTSWGSMWPDSPHWIRLANSMVQKKRSRQTKPLGHNVESCTKVCNTSRFHLQVLQCGSRSLSMLSVIGCRRQRSMWLAACSVAPAASVSLEQQLWWTTTWWRDTPPSPQRQATTSSMTKVSAV